MNDPGNALFDSYDVFLNVLNSGDCVPGSNSFLEKAACDFEDADGAYAAYRLGVEALQTEFGLLNDDAALRLAEIGDETTVGSEIWQQIQSILGARTRVERNRIEISNLEARVRIEIERRGEERRIKNAMSQVRIRYEAQQARLDEEIDKVNSIQQAANTVSFSDPISFVTSSANAAMQAAGDELKSQIEDEKRSLAAMERAEIDSLDAGLLDLESKTRIRTLMLEMNTLAIDSQLAALLVRQEVGRLVQLRRERDALEQKITARRMNFARRYHADPVFELRANAAAERANRSFTRAQEWLFYTARALEYAYVRQYRDDNPGVTGFSAEAIYRLRNAAELKDFFDEMIVLSLPAYLTNTRIPLQSTFSLRDDFMDLEGDIDAFRTRLTELIRFGDDCNGTTVDLNIDVCLVIELSTARERPDFFFRGHFADKIENFTLRVAGNAPIASASLLAEVLYGGVSLLRRPEQGQTGDRPDLLDDEILTFSTRSYRSTGNGFESRPAKRVSIQLAGGTGEGTTDSFQELSVAATGWRIMLPIQSFGLTQLLPEAIDDIELFFEHSALDRN